MSDGNYWIISRRKEGWMKVGQNIYSPNTLKLKEYDINGLLKKLNEKKLFDFDYKPQEGDKLEINFKINERDCEYGFIFSNGKWKKHFLSNCQELMEEMEFNLPPYIGKFKGIIENPFKNKKTTTNNV
jgi:hypothetical protein